METKKWLHIISFALVIIGGLNWGLFGLFNVDLVDVLLGGIPTFAEIIYVLIGVAALYLLIVHGKECRTCVAK